MRTHDDIMYCLLISVLSRLVIYYLGFPLN